jgi:hypothetical protein
MYLAPEADFTKASCEGGFSASMKNAIGAFDNFD